MAFILSVTILFVLGVPNTGHSKATVMETSSLGEALSSADSQTLIVIDLDETVITATPDSNLDRGYKFVLEIADRIHRERGLPLNDSRNGAWEQFISMRKQRAFETVEPDTASIIREKQSLLIPILGLTARPPEEAPVTEGQLNSVGIDLRNGPTFNQIVEFVLPNGALYRNGILYTGHKGNKGTSLVSFSKTVGFKPHRVLAVDNDHSRLDEVKTAVAKWRGVKFMGFRYARADSRTRALCNRHMKFN
jgi:hypothetical protein